MCKSIILLFSLFATTFAWQNVPLKHPIIPHSENTQLSRLQSSSLIKRTSTQLWDNVDSSIDVSERVHDGEEDSEKLCFYKVGDKWKQRIKLEELSVGQKLTGAKIRKADLLNAKTGPKIFFECGIGRVDSKGEWQMVSGMYRVAKNYAKPKVVKKKVDRLTDKEVELFVSKIRLSEGKLEVCTTMEEFERDMEKIKNRGELVSVSSLNVGQDVVGKVVDVRPYGVMVDVGANRNGLLHIQKVADLYGRFINKESGLIEAGLERGANVKLCVESIKSKRLFLDFTKETKELAIAEHEQENNATTVEESKNTNAKEQDEAEIQNDDGDDNDNESVDPYADEAAAWAAYYEDEDPYAEEKEDDEDRDIEDALGIGFY